MNDVKIFYEVVDGDDVQTVRGESIRLPYTDASFGSHADCDAWGRITGWTVTHLLSGAPVGTGRTRNAAFTAAVAYVEQNKPHLTSVFANAAQARVLLEHLQRKAEAR
ncbi:hypothetical protein KTD13_09165 [Burkholderia multivorans]|uniref:hypothetical protein n=1 Tax=Burkholderia multivorans TaxID=87883 RepID=UPI001C21722E|nr:hypothetical protein [Burkholderia multivorans]MBU9260515.1 hypothetical protein [Burkholderia multivorans]MBU9314826.1 hypothetical protein [Burkholderia multivorans]MDN7938719.1 hypothetical protein [Burkholderia multivorans]